MQPQITAKVALNLVLGHALTLVGQPESRWHDAKKQHATLSRRVSWAEMGHALSGARPLL